MGRVLLKFLFLPLILAVIVPTADAQFKGGTNCVGLHSGMIGGGIPFYGGAVPIGVDYEIGVGRTGLFGVGAMFDYYSLPADHRYLNLAVTILYHAKPVDTRLDPFFGVFLIYEAADYGAFGDLATSSPTAALGGGVRYFFNDNVAAELRLGGGWGFYLLSLGIDYAF